MKTVQHNSLIQAQFEMAWNEWIHGRDSEAANIWYKITKTEPESENDTSRIDAINYLAMYERIWEGGIESAVDVVLNKKNAEIIDYKKAE